MSKLEYHFDGEKHILDFKDNNSSIRMKLTDDEFDNFIKNLMQYNILTVSRKKRKLSVVDKGYDDYYRTRS